MFIKTAIVIGMMLTGLTILAGLGIKNAAQSVVDQQLTVGTTYEQAYAEANK